MPKEKRLDGVVLVSSVCSNILSLSDVPCPCLRTANKLESVCVVKLSVSWALPRTRAVNSSRLINALYSSVSGPDIRMISLT